MHQLLLFIYFLIIGWCVRGDTYKLSTFWYRLTLSLQKESEILETFTKYQPVETDFKVSSLMTHRCSLYTVSSKRRVVSLLYGIFRFDGYYEITLQKGGSEGEESACNVGDPNSIPGLGRSLWRRTWQPTPVSLPGESRGQRRLAGYGPWSRRESSMTSSEELPSRKASSQKSIRIF